jgi:hypothetical protein
METSWRATLYNKFEVVYVYMNKTSLGLGENVRLFHQKLYICKLSKNSLVRGNAETHCKYEMVLKSVFRQILWV